MFCRLLAVCVRVYPRFDDKTVQHDIKMWPFKVVEKETRPFIAINLGGAEKHFSPEEISAMVLTKMKVRLLGGAGARAQSFP